MAIDETVTTKAQLGWWIDECRRVKLFGFDTETTGLRVVQGDDELVGICLATSSDYGCYIPVGHTTGEPQLDLDYVLDALAPILEDTRYTKVAHNFSFDWGVMASYGIDVQGYHDTQLMSYAYDGQLHRARGHSFDALAKFHLDHDSIQFDDVVIPALGIHNFAQVRHAHATKYASEDARMTLALYHKLTELLEAEDLTTVYEDIDRPLAIVTGSMKFRGVSVDLEHLDQLHNRFVDKCRTLQEEIYDACGIEFNVASTKQLGQVLYDELDLDIKATTESGAGKTDKDTLELLKNDHPVVPLLLDYSKYSTLISNITQAWPQIVSRETGRIHGGFNLTVTNTRRLSASDPNLQNVPTRSEEGEEIRTCVVAPKGRRLVCMDASQIEYRLLAHVTQQPVMIQAFKDGHDFHAAMAARVLGGDWKEYANEKNEKLYAERSRFKNVNFATIYGAGPRKIAAMCKIPEKRAYQLLDDYATEFPEVLDWKEDVKTFAREHGYVETLFGGRIHVPFIRWSDKGMQAMGERQAVNGVIQGTAAEIIRIAMARVFDELKQWRDAWLLLQVHDELVVECWEDDADDVAAMVKRVIETCTNDIIRWRIPIVSKGGHGKTWYEAK